MGESKLIVGDHCDDIDRDHQVDVNYHDIDDHDREKGESLYLLILTLLVVTKMKRLLVNFVVSVWNQLSQQWLTGFAKSDEDDTRNIGWVQHRGAKSGMVQSTLRC